MPKDSGESFYQLCTAAVADFAEHGYDSEARLEEWLTRLRIAAQREMVPEHLAVERIRESLGAIYRRLVERGSMVSRHPDVARFTLERVRPALRAELDRRIMASSRLIKINREEAVEKTLRRFAGWATSVPAGGSGNVAKVETKANVRRSLAGLSFVERRVAVDQGAKLAATLSDILAKDGGAIAARWYSRYRVANYDFRKDHAKRDGKIYLIRGSWAHQRRLVKPGPAGYTDEITMPAEEVFCLPGDSEINHFDDVEKAYKRAYDGQMVVLRTSTGAVFRATPNHPVMTSKGWVAVGSLDKADDLVEIADQRIESSKLHANKAEICISDLFKTMSQVGSFQETRFGMCPDFHGDGTNEKIDIVSFDRPLRFDVLSFDDEPTNHFDLSLSDFLPSGVGTIDESFQRFDRTANGHLPFYSGLFSIDVGYSSSSQSNSIENCRRGHAKTFRDLSGAFPSFVPESQFGIIETNALRPGAEVDDASLMPAPDSHWMDVKDFAYIRERFPFATQLSNVVDVDRLTFSGHVYNLQTASGWYSVNGIIASNCRCSYTYFHALRRLPDDMLTEAGRAELERIVA